MAAEKKWTDVLFDVCALLMKEVGMPRTALAELHGRANAIAPNELQSFQSVMFWKSATVNFLDLQEKFMKLECSKNLPAPVQDKTQIPDLNETPIPDLNELPPQNEIQDRGKAVEAEATTGTGKRKITDANHSVIKRSKFIQDSVGPATGDKGNGVLKMEGWGEN